MTLDCFISTREIQIDAAGWGSLLLGVVIGALKPPDPMLMERRIPIASFQAPNFQKKKYFEDSIRIADEIIRVMQPDESTCFKVSSEYVLSALRSHLASRGFNVQKVEPSSELRGMVERGYLRWCSEVGVPEEVLRDRKRFWSFLEWVAEKPHTREGLVKTGWASWQRKWREEIYTRPLNLST
jgi:hypothetical protein